MSCPACGAPRSRIIANRCHDCGHDQSKPQDARPNGFGVL